MNEHRYVRNIAAVVIGGLVSGSAIAQERARMPVDPSSASCSYQEAMWCLGLADRNNALFDKMYNTAKNSFKSPKPNTRDAMSAWSGATDKAKTRQLREAVDRGGSNGNHAASYYNCAQIVNNAPYYYRKFENSELYNLGNFGTYYYSMASNSQCKAASAATTTARATTTTAAATTTTARATTTTAAATTTTIRAVTTTTLASVSGGASSCMSAATMTYSDRGWNCASVVGGWDHAAQYNALHPCSRADAAAVAAQKNEGNCNRLINHQEKLLVDAAKAMGAPMVAKADAALSVAQGIGANSAMFLDKGNAGVNRDFWSKWAGIYTACKNGITDMTRFNNTCGTSDSTGLQGLAKAVTDTAAACRGSTAACKISTSGIKLP